MTPSDGLAQESSSYVQHRIVAKRLYCTMYETMMSEPRTTG